MSGTFVLSLDTELAWGTMDKHGCVIYRKHLAKARDSVRALIDILEERRISATWALVGHLFLDCCKRPSGCEDPHPDALTPKYAWHPNHWHSYDPATDLRTDPFWYGADIVKQIRDATTEQEIGCHTFSHIVMDDPAVTKEIAISQLRKCTELAQAQGLRLSSFAFPRNGVAHLAALRECGFTNYRGPETNWYRQWPTVLRPLCHYADRLLSLTPPVYAHLSICSEGLVNIPASMFLMPPDGLRCLIPGRSRIRQAQKGLVRAARDEAVFHLWFHPWNLGSSPAVVLWLRSILDEAARMRDSGDIRIMTMGQLATEVIHSAGVNLRLCQ